MFPVLNTSPEHGTAHDTQCGDHRKMSVSVSLVAECRTSRAFSIGVSSWVHKYIYCVSHSFFLQRVLWLNDTSMCDCFSHLIAPPHILNSVSYIKLHSFPHILVFIPLNSIHKSPRYRKLRVTAYFGTIAFRLGRNPRKRPSNSPVRLV